MRKWLALANKKTRVDLVTHTATSAQDVIENARKTDKELERALVQCDRRKSLRNIDSTKTAHSSADSAKKASHSSADSTAST